MQLATQDFIRAAGIAAKVTKRRNTIPVLSTMHCKADGDRMIMSATDLDAQIDVTAKMPRKNGVEAFCLDKFDSIARAVKIAGNDEIGLQRDESKIKVMSGKFAMSTTPLQAEDFPHIGQLYEQHDFAATVGKDFFRQLRRVQGAISTEEVRYYLNGVYFHHVKDWGYTFVATDGHRLNMCAVELPDAQGSTENKVTWMGKEQVATGIIIPRKTVALLLDLADRMGDKPARFIVGCKMTRNSEGTLAPDPNRTPYIQCDFEIGGMPVRLTSKTIDGAFPQYQRVIPREEGKLATFKAAELRRAIEAVTVGSTEKSRAVRLSFGDDSCSVKCNWVAISEGSAETVVQYQGGVRGMEVGYNGRYLIDMLDALGPVEEVTFAMQDALSPTIVVSPNCTTFKGVLMPMRV